ncbi:hypothetical protein ACFSM7_11445 [Clavibacter michiganensis subsp. tessellarius]|uniref:hypothetical protein n=1 Tax=Clavibacter tessellarius TaxID=31965 RepID=UPI00363DA599
MAHDGHAPTGRTTRPRPVRGSGRDDDVAGRDIDADAARPAGTSDPGRTAARPSGAQRPREEPA